MLLHLEGEWWKVHQCSLGLERAGNWILPLLKTHYRRKGTASSVKFHLPAYLWCCTANKGTDTGAKMPGFGSWCSGKVLCTLGKWDDLSSPFPSVGQGKWAHPVGVLQGLLRGFSRKLSGRNGARTGKHVHPLRIFSCHFALNNNEMFRKIFC